MKNYHKPKAINIKIYHSSFLKVERTIVYLYIPVHQYVECQLTQAPSRCLPHQQRTP